jgi:hypothetical protein
VPTSTSTIAIPDDRLTSRRRLCANTGHSPLAGERRRGLGRRAKLRAGRGPMTETRKLAAILVADVVGYSRLAGADEDRTLARLRATLGAGRVCGHKEAAARWTFGARARIREVKGPPQTAAALLCLPLLAGCTKQVTYYAAHAAERQARLQACLGTVENDGQDCRNAAQAD